jgi:two-component system, OmpR family, sensor histidine kinase KdpD
MFDSEYQRPDPDELLKSFQNEEEKRKQGWLKIFFGMCAGVGKTYTMLETAKAENSKGKDVIIGYIETHNRKEIVDLTQGFEIIQRKKIEYKGTSLEEMDLDAIIQRKPGIVIVDELAHTNAPWEPAS